MKDYSFNDISNSNDRYKLYTMLCSPEDLAKCIDYFHSKNLKPINIGKKLAAYIDSLNDYSYLNIDVYEYTKKLLDKYKSRINGSGNDVVAVYNLGIFLEPRLELNAVHLLKEFSKSAVLIIIWENQTDNQDRLNWFTQQNEVFLDFSETQIKKLRYEVQ